MSGSRTQWKKPTRVYDYNYNLGEHYYKPQLRHADLKFHGKAGSPPKAQSFAERFAADPVYGSYGSPRSSFPPPPRNSSLTEDPFGRIPRATGDRFQQRSDRLSHPEELEFGRSPFPPNEDLRSEFGKPRFSFGDRLLDAVGTKGRGSGRSEYLEPPSPREDPFQDPFLGKRYGNMGGDSDFMNEDQFKSTKTSRGFESSSADELMEGMRRDAESSASKFRAKLRAKKANEDSDFGTTQFGLDGHGEDSTESRIEKIRARAKARIAEAMEDDFTSPPAGATKSYFGNKDDLDLGMSGGGSKSVKMSKRMLKTTFDMD